VPIGVAGAYRSSDFFFYILITYKEKNLFACFDNIALFSLTLSLSLFLSLGLAVCLLFVFFCFFLYEASS
ncbi:MAG: hypothetical protein PV344_03335, partial [Anaplasma sp.]|nr:hypothetical protein [Anaplasma sp.]